MSRLLNPGLGDYLDRATILRLKIRQARELGADYSHFQTELDAIEERVGGLAQWAHQPAWKLAEVNQRLWTLNDQIAVYVNQPLGEFPQLAPFNLAEYALDQYRLNLERADLVRQLNGGGPPEKLS